MTLAERTAALIATVEQYRAERCARTPAARGGRGAHDRPRRTGRRPPPGHHRDRRRAQAPAARRRRGRSQPGHGTATRGAAACRAATGPCLDGAARSAGRSAGPNRRRVARWVEAHLDRAVECLAHDAEWRIRHHAAWHDDERRAAAAALRTRGIGAAFEHDPALSAGFVVTCGHNVLDASLDGLLADRAGIEGRLLQRLEDVPA